LDALGAGLEERWSNRGTWPASMVPYWSRSRMDSERYVLEVGAELVKLDRVIAGPDDGASEQAVTEGFEAEGRFTLG
jgi:hypothetical protein